MLTPSQKRTIALKLHVVEAQAASLREDLESGKLWEGDCNRKIGTISEALNEARQLAANDN